MNRADSSVNLEKQVCDWLSLQHVPKYELSYDVLCCVAKPSKPMRRMSRWGKGCQEAHSMQNSASDEELEGPMKDQPLSADASPTALSPGYIANSDPEEDKEDPKEDPADHPADG
ncbi:hypothetical protein Tco_0747942 [Tanacetum coccineum]|uniref:Uncharacterized protein n=1 Tax=Tanacetum coccineum TaxID=301880 RepID=A0ABQ4YVC7_9ASTR